MREFTRIEVVADLHPDRLATATRAEGDGVRHPTRRLQFDCTGGIGRAAVGAIALQILVTKLGFKDKEGSKLQQKIYSLSVPRRLFIVVTAAVAEEVLYRGYAIGIGQYIWGGLTIAFVVSLVVLSPGQF